MNSLPRGHRRRASRAFREKYEALRRYGVERFVCLRFDTALRSMSPDEFVGKVLVEALGARHVVVGHDFKFGRNMAGNVATLRAAGPAAGFVVTEVPPFEIDGERVSSSLIRAALDAGDMARATRLLGRPYRMTGKVIEGAKLGRKLGFPTANLRPQRRATPLAGVFAIRVSGGGLQNAPGVASLGTRPCGKRQGAAARSARVRLRRRSLSEVTARRFHRAAAR